MSMCVRYAGVALSATFLFFSSFLFSMEKDEDEFEEISNESIESFSLKKLPPLEQYQEDYKADNAARKKRYHLSMPPSPRKNNRGSSSSSQNVSGSVVEYTEPLSPSSHLRRKVKELDDLRDQDPCAYEELARTIRKLETRPYLPWLSFTGGGIRGIIGAKMLAIFEEKTGRKVRELFPLMAGTSTGGLLATLFTLGVPAKEVVELYKDYATSIFEPKYRLNPGGVRGPKYNIENLKDVIYEYVGDKRLAEVEGDLLITAYNASRKRTEVFKSWEARQNPLDKSKNPRLVKLLAASAAAPTYFDPVRIKGEAYIDGGIFANDPAACALAEINRRYGKVNHMAILLGTGKVDRGFSEYEDLTGRGTLGQVKDIIDYAIGGNVDTARYIVKQMLPNIGSFQQLYLIDPVISKDFAEMDCTDSKVLHRLELYADEYVDAEKDKPWLRKLVEELVIKEKLGRIAKPKVVFDRRVSTTGMFIKAL